MTRSRLLLIGSAIATIFSATQASALEGVVASVKPIHSLVSAVMEGVGEPQLLVKGAGSPHTYSMRPSEAGMLEQAKVVFWVGPGLDTFLEKPLETLAGGARVVELAETPGLTLLDMREGGAFEAHVHDDEDGHDHHAHDEDDHHEAHADEHEHEHEETHADEHGHEEAHADGHSHDDDHGHEEAHADHGHDDHAHDGKDMHVWLDPENARQIVRQIATTLSEVDPENAATYEANATALDARLDELTAKTNETLAPVRGKPFVVFHDGYQYFEHAFDIPASGSITVSPEVQPGAKRLGEIHDKITELGAACVFSEPQFEPKLVTLVTEETNARSGVLDPLGADIEEGPELYFTLVGNLAQSLAGCLSKEG